MTTREQQRAWLAANPGKSAEYSRRYREKHPEELRTRGRKLACAYREKKREEINRKKREWAKANPEICRARARAWRAANVEKRRTAMRRWQNIPEPTRARPGLCENCGRLPGRKGMHVDHDHTLGTFRGWLCSNCNTGLGKLGDNVEGLERAIQYLKRAKASNDDRV